MKDGKIEVTDGPHVGTKETLGGIPLLEARDLADVETPEDEDGGIRDPPG